MKNVSVCVCVWYRRTFDDMALVLEYLRCSKLEGTTQRKKVTVITDSHMHAASKRHRGHKSASGYAIIYLANMRRGFEITSVSSIRCSKKEQQKTAAHSKGDFIVFLPLRSQSHSLSSLLHRILYASRVCVSDKRFDYLAHFIFVLFYYSKSGCG